MANAMRIQQKQLKLKKFIELKNDYNIFFSFLIVPSKTQIFSFFKKV